MMRIDRQQKRQGQRGTLLGGDDRGAIMLLAVFMAVLAISLVYFGFGVAHAALLRQRLQDGADASALSGAIMQARSMNLLVLFNLVMAALLAILVLLKLVEALCIAAMMIAGFAAIPSWGGTLPLIPSLEPVRAKVNALYEELKPPIEKALDAINFLSDQVASAAPEVSQSVARKAVGPSIQDVYIDAADQLPVTDDSYEKLCREAGKLPAELAAGAMNLPQSGPIYDFVTQPLSDVMGELAATFSDWFCGTTGGGNPPAFEISEQVWYPQDDVASACESTASRVADTDFEALADADTVDCGMTFADAEAAAPDKETGECTQRCTVDGPYDKKTKLARQMCDPREEEYELYAYQIREGTVEYTWNGDRWVRGEPEYEQPQFLGSAEDEERPIPPCGTVNSPYGLDYNLTVRTSDDFSEVQPVCSDEQAPSAMPQGIQRNRNPSRAVRFTEVRHILGCARQESQPVEVEAERSEGSEDRTPKKVEDDKELGDEAFQMRVVVRSVPRDTFADRLVKMSLWGEDEEASTFSQLGAFRRFGVAQSEFFYDDSTGRETWMWNMKWTARLVRFRAEPEQLDPFYGDCSGGLGRVADRVGLGDVGLEDVDVGAVGDTLGIEELSEVGQCQAFVEQLGELGPLVTH